MRVLYLTFLSFAYGAAALAAEATHGVSAEKAEGQLPQFDLTSFPSQTFWLFVTFVIVYVCVKTMVMPQLGGTLEKRDAHINDALQTAGVLNEKARLLQSDYEARMVTARQDAQSKLQIAKDTIAQEFAASDTKQRETFTAQRTAFVTRFEAGKADLMAALTTEAQTLAAQVADKVLSAAASSKKKAA